MDDNVKLYEFEITEQWGLKSTGLPPAFEEGASERSSE